MHPKLAHRFGKARRVGDVDPDGEAGEPRDDQNADLACSPPQEARATDVAVGGGRRDVDTLIVVRSHLATSQPAFARWPLSGQIASAIPSVATCEIRRGGKPVTSDGMGDDGAVKCVESFDTEGGLPFRPDKRHRDTEGASHSLTVLWDNSS